MADDSTAICIECQKQFAAFCYCSYPLPRLCSLCLESHRNKRSQITHIELPIVHLHRIESQEEQLRINYKFLSICRAEEMLKVNLRSTTAKKGKKRVRWVH